MGTQALIGLGSNLGDRRALLDFATAALSRIPSTAVKAVSSYHETKPVGGPEGQGAFLNAAGWIETSLEPEPLLAALQAIEQDSGRVRTVHWSERTLDLDLLLYDDQVIDTPRLRVPHPWMALRRFVLAPLAEIAPEIVDPLTGLTIRALLANLDRRPSYVAFAAGPRHYGGLALAVGSALQERLRWLHVPPLYVPVVRALAAVPIGLQAFEWRSDPELPRGLIEDLDRATSRFHMQIEKLPVRNKGLSESELEWLASFTQTFNATNFGPIARVLDQAAWPDSEWGDRWLVSPFWFDAMFLTLDSVKTLRPRGRVFCDAFLEARSHVLAPTFVVARRGEGVRLPIQNPKFAWHWPIGRDTPILWVDDFESDASLDTILAGCAATRAG